MRFASSVASCRRGERRLRCVEAYRGSNPQQVLSQVCNYVVIPLLRPLCAVYTGDEYETAAGANAVRKWFAIP